ncbi:MAG TPA: O-antigen polymerase, partial [Pinirhizobacter sp.]|nr:O-antigen polymerase [Pinirhizobacter sp.]
MFVLILLYVVLTIIRPQDYMPGLVGVPLLPAVLVLAFGLFIAGKKNLSAPQFLLLPVFLLVLMISEVTNGWMGGTVDQLGKFGPTVIAFFVLATACTSPRRLGVTMGTIAACAAVLALHGIGQ